MPFCWKSDAVLGVHAGDGGVGTGGGDGRLGGREVFDERGEIGAEWLFFFVGRKGAVEEFFVRLVFDDQGGRVVMLW